MNQDDLNRCFLKAFGLALLFMAIVAIPKAVGGIFALIYWGWVSGFVFWGGANDLDSSETIVSSIAANHGIEGIKSILSFLVLGWLSIQVLKEKPWIGRLTRIGKAEQVSDGKAGKPSGDERTQ